MKHYFSRNLGPSERLEYVQPDEDDEDYVSRMAVKKSMQHLLDTVAVDILSSPRVTSTVARKGIFGHEIDMIVSFGDTVHHIDAMDDPSSATIAFPICLAIKEALKQSPHKDDDWREKNLNLTLDALRELISDLELANTKEESPLTFNKESSSVYKITRHGDHVGCLSQTADGAFKLEVVPDSNDPSGSLTQEEVKQILYKIRTLNE